MSQVLEEKESSVFTYEYSPSVDSLKPQDFSSALTQESILLGVNVNSDTFMSESEKEALVGKSLTVLVSPATLHETIQLLRAKNKFSKITLTIKKYQEGIFITFDLQSFWTFGRLIIRGISVGKESFIHFYPLKSGQLFDKERHEHGIEKIREVCRNEGYFDVVCRDHCAYDHSTKTITVTISINRNKRYTLKAAHFNLSFERSSDAAEESLIKNILEKHCSAFLLGHPYNTKILAEFTAGINQQLARIGYMHTDVSLHTNVTPESCGVELFFDITLNPKKEFVFFGNTELSANDLLKRMLAFGRSTALLPPSLLAEEIERIYKEKGFLQASVTAQDEDMRSFFIIKEGKCARIERLEIHNAPFVKHHNADKKLFRSVLNKKVVDHTLIKTCCDRMVNFYKDHGFLDATLVEYELKPLSAQSDTYTLEVFFNEGQQLFINAIEIDHEGASISARDVLQYAPMGPEGLLLTPALIAEQRASLLAHFRHQGYRAVRVYHSLELHNEKKALVWHVSGIENPALFGSTILQSSVQVPFDVLELCLDYKKGEVWNSQKLQNSVIRLKELDIFSSVGLSPAYELCNSQQVPLIMALQENDRHELRLRFGGDMQHVQHYQTFGGLTYRIGGTFLVRNPLFRGGLFKINADFTRSNGELIVDYQVPFIGRSPYNLLCQFYTTNFGQPGFIGSDKNTYTVVQHGMLAALTRKVSRQEYTCNFGLEWVKTSFTSVHTQRYARRLARAINFNQELIGALIPYIYIEPTFFIDRTDNSADPHTGSSVLLTAKAMLPLNNIGLSSFFVKTFVDYALFVPVLSAVFAARFRLGHIFYQHFASLMPSERFYLGGAHSLRGYETDLAPPYGIFSDPSVERTRVPRGGKSMGNLNLEIRIPLLKKLGIVFFQDMGILAGGTASLFSEHLLSASGFGFRYATPIGPLRFDMGFKWRRVHKDEPFYTWFLTFGHAF